MMKNNLYTIKVLVIATIRRVARYIYNNLRYRTGARLIDGSRGILKYSKKVVEGRRVILISPLLILFE